MIPLLLALLLLSACAGPQALDSSAGVWEKYDIGVSMLWIHPDIRVVDAECRSRGADPEGRRTDRLRGCADFCANEVFSIRDFGVVAHETWHAATRSVIEPLTTCPINAPGETP